MPPEKLKLTMQEVVCETIVPTKFGSPPEGGTTQKYPPNMVPKMKLLNYYTYKVETHNVGWCLETINLNKSGGCETIN